MASIIVNAINLSNKKTMMQVSKAPSTPKRLRHHTRRRYPHHQRLRCLYHDSAQAL